MVAVWVKSSLPTQLSWQTAWCGCVGKLSNAHTPAPSYVAHQIHLFVSRFVQKTVDDDSGVWASWTAPTRVGVNISVELTTIMLACPVRLVNITDS